jgi:hypothetical protein
MEDVAKERKGRRNSKESSAKMNKNREMNDSIGGKMVQSNLKVTKEVMKKSRGGKIESVMNEGDKRTISPRPRVRTCAGLEFSNRQIPYPRSGHH